jgi:hypothetical protein
MDTTGDLMALLDRWEPTLRLVARTRSEMERGQCYRPLREAYEAAVAGREELSKEIEGLQLLPCGGTMKAS